jgi:hypothetical protein
MSGHEVRWCFHTTAMVADYEYTRDALIRIAGLRVLEDSRIDDPAIGRRGGMAWLADNVLEIGEPIVARGAVDRFVSRFGSHMSSIAAQVEDLDATLDFLAANGVRLSSRIGDHIAFTNPADTAGVVIEWYDDEDRELDPRFGAPLPAPLAPPILDVAQMAFGGAVVADPVGDAERLAALIGHGVTFVDEQAPPGSPVAGVSMGDLTLALYPIPDAGASERLWGHIYSRPQTCNLGLRVPDLIAARTALVAADVEVLRDEAESIVIGPEVTGGVTLVLVETLLPGDPRRETVTPT